MLIDMTFNLASSNLNVTFTNVRALHAVKWHNVE